MNSKVSVEIRNLSKKFANDVKYNMLYGTISIFTGADHISGLRKNEFWALQNINLDFHSGEICALIGQNGSGKTTLIRLLAGIYTQTHGTIDLKGHSITPVFAVKAGLNPILTGRENIYYSGAQYGMSREQIQLKTSYIEEFSELKEYLDMPVGNYSSGMKARLGYTIATATDPDIFVVDEALAVGDVYFRQKCFDQLKHWTKEKGKTIIFVTNNHLKVEKIAQRVVVLKHGQLVKDTNDVNEAMTYYTSSEYRNLSLEKT